jgi:heterodisulfide reductase subunit B
MRPGFWKKLGRLEEAEAASLVTDCPGCVMQLRGGEEKRGKKLRVEHMAEYLQKGGNQHPPCSGAFRHARERR